MIPNSSIGKRLQYGINYARSKYALWTSLIYFEATDLFSEKFIEICHNQLASGIDIVGTKNLFTIGTKFRNENYTMSSINESKLSILPNGMMLSKKALNKINWKLANDTNDIFL